MMNIQFSLLEAQKLSGLSRGVVDNLRTNGLIKAVKNPNLQLDYFEVIKMSIYKELCSHFTPQYSGKIFKRLVELTNREPSRIEDIINKNFLALLYKEDTHNDTTGFFFLDFNEKIGEQFIYNDSKIAQLGYLTLYVSVDRNASRSEEFTLRDVTLIYLKGIRENIDEKGNTIKEFEYKKTNSKYCLVA